MKSHQWRRGSCGGLFFVIICLLPAARGEQVTVTYVEGEGYIQSSEEVDWRALGAEELLSEGDQLWTGRGGRMEVAIPDALLIRMDFDTHIELPDRDFPLRLRLKKGHLYLKRKRAAGRIDFRPVRIEAGPFEIDLSSPSIVRVDHSEEGVRVSVLKGEAHVFGETGSVMVRGEQTLHGEGGLFSEPIRWERSSFDGFDVFSEEQDLLFAQQTLSPEGGPGSGDLSTLDGYGEWMTLPTHGRVFRPFVSSGWRPFFLGEWVFAEHGWTWISHEPWGTIPHHFGRWIWVSTVGWCWIPGTVWAPAPVVWVVIGDHLAWAPIGTSLVTIETHVHFWNIAEIRSFQTGRVAHHHELTASLSLGQIPRAVSDPTIVVRTDPPAQSPPFSEHRFVPLRPPLQTERFPRERPPLPERQFTPGRPPRERERPRQDRREGPEREDVREDRRGPRREESVKRDGGILPRSGGQEAEILPQQPDDSHRKGSRHGHRGPHDQERREQESRGRHEKKR